ncbi:MAG: hypothetical protein LBS77_06940 [Desulfovibrio sp.]|nr:hypothetical protein [Desulfovibrio sp.]
MRERIATLLTRDGVKGSDEALNLTIYRPDTGSSASPFCFTFTEATTDRVQHGI